MRILFTLFALIMAASALSTQELTVAQQKLRDHTATQFDLVRNVKDHLLNYARSQTYFTGPEAFLPSHDNVVRRLSAVSDSLAMRQGSNDPFENLSPQCQNLAAGLLASNCLSLDSEPSPAQLCNGSCGQQFINFVSQCATDWDENNEGPTRVYLQILCLRDDQGQLCLSVFENLSELENDTNGLPTEAQLNLLCNHPCLQKLINLFASYIDEFQADNDVSGVQFLQLFQILCTRDGDRWCVRELGMNGDDPFEDCDSAGSVQMEAQCLNNTLNTVCGDRCWRKVFGRIVNIVEDPIERAQIRGYYNFMCSQDDSTPPNRCIPQMVESMDAFAQECPTITNGTCAGCESAAATFVSSNGCCLSTFNEFLLAADNDMSLQNGIAACNQTMPSPCPIARGNVTAERTIVLRMSLTFVQNNQAELTRAIRDDIAVNVGVPFQTVTVVIDLAASSNNRIVVHVTIQGEDDAQTAEAQSDIDGQISGETLSLPETAKLYGSQGVLEVDNDATQQQNGLSGVDSASSVAVSASLLLCAIVALL